MQILDGNKLSKDIRVEIKNEVSSILNSGHRAPHLAAILVGENPASQSYVNYKIKDCEDVGFKSTLHRLPTSITEDELIELINKLNTEEDLDGFIVQLPLPKHIDEERVIMAINPDRDVDGFHPTNFGKMALDMPTFLPATPFGILEMLERYEIETKGKNCVIVGRSHIVGRPMSILMSRKGYPGNCTVTNCHSATKNVEEITKEADIVITALGVPNFLTGSMIKDGAVVIDVGISRVDDASKKSGFKLVGDVDFESAKEKSSYITPVPGGVGPMTRSMLLKNTLLAYKRNVLHDNV